MQSSEGACVVKPPSERQSAHALLLILSHVNKMIQQVLHHPHVVNQIYDVVTCIAITAVQIHHTHNCLHATWIPGYSRTPYSARIQHNEYEHHSGVNEMTPGMG